MKNLLGSFELARKVLAGDPTAIKELKQLEINHAEAVGTGVGKTKTEEAEADFERTSFKTPPKTRDRLSKWQDETEERSDRLFHDVLGPG